jgi:NAD(P)-dependent dehydrogenase (short-subunit alcohol dehydrogenase family)
VSLELDLSGRVALVTGGSQGIGAGIARVLVDAGATVVTCARSAVETPAPGTSHVQCDVRDPEAVTAMVAGIVQEHGRLDVLVNNAGGSPHALAADASPRFLDKILALNLTAPLLVAQAANAVMQWQESGGAIVNISSVSALRPSPGTAAYGAAKAGVDSLTRSLAVEWAPRVRVNAIDVGLCRTEQTTDHYGGDDTVAAIEATIPLGRMAEPTEIGNVVCFLASDLASYVSGATVECHGGGEPPAFLHVVQKENE